MTFIADILFSGTLTIHGVLRCIDSVVGEWFQLGLELGIPASTVETIEYILQGELLFMTTAA